MGNCNKGGGSLLVTPQEHVQKHLVYLEVVTQIFKAFDCALIPAKFVVGGKVLGFRV